MNSKKNGQYETKIVVPEEKKREEPKSPAVKNECPLCQGTNVVRHEIPVNIVVITCLRGECKYVAKYANGRLI